QITEDMQNITEAEITLAMNEAKGVSDSVNEENVYSDAYLGKILDFAGKTYYAQIDIANSLLAEKENISSTRSLGVGMTGYTVQTSSMFNTTVGINEGSLYIDIDLNTVSAVSRSGDKESEYRFITAAGVISSYYEGLIWEELTGEKGISTISLLNTALKDNQKLLMLSSANFEAEKSKLHADSATMQEITRAVNAGKIVTIHSDKLTVDDWQGYGYIITDPETGGAAYMISGGLSGGSTSGLVTISYLVNIGFAIADMIQVINMIPTMLSAFSMGGPIGIAIGVVVATVMTALVIAAIYDYISSIQLMIAYMNGDESAGQQLMLNSLFNIGFGVGGALLGGVTKRAVKAVAKNKIVKMLGEEIAEKLLKNVSDPTDITRLFKQLSKGGLSDDAIKKMVENSGEEGLEWLSKQVKNGVSGEILDKIAKNAVDYTKYSDDLIRKIASSNGYADDIIKYVNKYGDDAVKAITKYGDDAAKVISDYADDGLKALNKGVTPTTINNFADHNVTPDILVESLSKSADNFTLDKRISDAVLDMPKGTRPDPSSYLPKSYIDKHLAQFDDGATYLLSYDDYERFYRDTQYIARNDGTLFCMPSNFVDEVKSTANGDLSKLDELLGYDNGFFENADTMVRIDIIDPKKSNISIPNGNEVGANNNWLPGGYTSGGVPEGIVYNVPNNSSYIKVTLLDNALNELN
ncbi:MAG: hypothetical protein Q4D26_12745, partial [Clostridia bacterium]|nr:hypothetical protein [Clostridia bacterium]